MERQKVSSGAPWEALVGYSRAVRVGPHVHVSGTTATDETGALVGRGDPYRQTVQALDNVRRALGRLGGGFEHVVRTRMFVTDITQWEAIGGAHAEAFSDVRPATSMVEVSRLIDPEMLVEVEVEAYVA